MITITGADILSATTYVGELVDDFKPLLFLLIGLYFAFYVITSLIDLANTEKEADEWFYDETGKREMPESFKTSFSQEERDELSGQKWLQRYYRNNE